jgi:putative glutamine amidotransferase
MRRHPLILITACTQRDGVEFSDASVSLSGCYTSAVMAAGGLPWILPAALDAARIAQCVGSADGLILTGGDDVQTGLYTDEVSAALKHTVGKPDRNRDLTEMQLIQECLRQQKPLLAICRGHQLLNVALGGKLIIDIDTEMPNALDHRQFKRKNQPVHPIAVTPGSLLSRLTRKPVLKVNSTHHQGVREVAPPLRATGVSPDGVVEAMELEYSQRGLCRFLLSVQFHPERLIDHYREFFAIFRGFISACRHSHGERWERQGRTI